MTYPRQLFRHPGPYGLDHRSYAVAGAADEEEEAALLENGWFLTVEEAWGEKPKSFDHDGDGEPGGSKAPEPSDDLAELRAAYKDKMGKKPFPGWDADELRRRMGE